MELDGVLNMPGSEETSPAQLIVVGHDLEVHQAALKEGGQGVEGRLPEPPRGNIFIILHPLDPPAEADLMNAFDDLHGVGIGVEIAAVPDARVDIASRRGDAAVDD